MAEALSAPSAPVEALSQLEDILLVRQAQGGSAAAYDELVRRYQRQIYGVIYHMTAHHEDADDLAQEVFVKAWQALKSFKGDSSFFTWLYRIAINRTLNHLKQRNYRNSRHAMSLNDLDVDAERHPDLVALVSDKTPRRDLALEELKEKLNAAMQRLSENHRTVVSLHDIQGLPHDEIAIILGCNVATVRTRLFYARQQLQGILSDYLK
ncbi:MAG: sigma-70 family RNA polymerase sigma factor [Verrucomicrobia bacterium]|nr:sigma-70 family RNA polymerase sigma factor [Verrucomicrobiota bacterium]MBM3869638.1 sigma-70 family RNA polymerase sigma factor [Verrucomicrobiota bacterium]